MSEQSNEREPVKDLATLNSLDERDMLAGYNAGLNGDGHEPSIELNRSYWHGWRNGRMDRYKMSIDEAARALAHEYVNRKRGAVS